MFLINKTLEVRSGYMHGIDHELAHLEYESGGKQRNLMKVETEEHKN